MDEEQSKTITIGLAMSGAISAGAYSAGVLDFLIEALEAWERHRPRPDVPDHRVIIATSAGASAGAITSAIGLVSATRPLFPLYDRDGDEPEPKAGQDAYHTLPDLYRAWVDLPDFLTDTVTVPGLPKPLKVGALLGLDDLDIARERATKEVEAQAKASEGLKYWQKRRTPKLKLVSVLNSVPLERIGRWALGGLFTKFLRHNVPGSVDAGKPFEDCAASVPKPYLAEDAHLYLTLTNLRGVPYGIDFTTLPQGGAVRKANPYIMMSHGDRAHYLLTGVGTVPVPTEWADNDHPERKAPSEIKAVLAPSGDDVTLSDPDWLHYITYTLTSSAFPIGLSARAIDMPERCYGGRSWPLPISFTDMANIKPRFPQRSPADPDRRIPFAGVDGGALDNDPFQIVRYVLQGDPMKPLKEDPAEVDRMIMMISPFPEPPEYISDDEDASDITLQTVVSRLVPTFMQNARFKPAELVDALKADTALRWLVSPRRYAKVMTNGKPEYEFQPFGIACGLLGGFGGFLDIEFRRHDYELGRANCQMFLGNWFGLPDTNRNLGTVKQPLPQLSIGGGPDKPQFAVIPLCGNTRIPVKVRDWPRVDRAKVDAFVERTKLRLDAVKNFALEDNPWYARWGTWLFSGLYEQTIKNIIREKLMIDLVIRNQYEEARINGYDLLTRRVLAALMGARTDYRTVEGIARDLKPHHDADEMHEPGHVEDADNPDTLPDEVRTALARLTVDGFATETTIDSITVHCLSDGFRAVVAPARWWLVSGALEAPGAVYGWFKRKVGWSKYTVD